MGLCDPSSLSRRWHSAIHPHRTDRLLPMEDYTSSSDHTQLIATEAYLTSSLAAGPFCHLFPVFSHLLLLKSSWSSFSPPWSFPQTFHSTSCTIPKISYPCIPQGLQCSSHGDGVSIMTQGVSCIDSSGKFHNWAWGWSSPFGSPRSRTRCFLWRGHWSFTACHCSAVFVAISLWSCHVQLTLRFFPVLLLHYQAKLNNLKCIFNTDILDIS